MSQLGEAYAWRRLLLATPHLGDASPWRLLVWVRLILATPLLGHSLNLCLLFLNLCSYIVWEGKTETKLYLNFFFFYLGDLIKTPEREKECPLYNCVFHNFQT